MSEQVTYGAVLTVTHIVDAWHENDYLEVVPIKPIGEPLSYVVLVAQENGRSTEIQLDDIGVDQLTAALVAARSQMRVTSLDLGPFPTFDEDPDAPTTSTEKSNA